MTSLTYKQAVQLAGAFLGPDIELVDTGIRSYNRCQIKRIVHYINWKFYTEEICCGKDWLECLSVILPELRWRDFESTPMKWSEYVAELRAIRKSKQSRKGNSAPNIRTNGPNERGEDS